MNKKNCFEGGGLYVAPEMEVISVVAEQGFSISDVEGHNYGDLDDLLDE